MTQWKYLPIPVSTRNRRPVTQVETNLMTIGEISQHFGISCNKFRFWISCGAPHVTIATRIHDARPAIYSDPQVVTDWLNARP